MADLFRAALDGAGREGLQRRGFAMRPFRPGLRAAMVGDMTAPPACQPHQPGTAPT